MKNQDANNNPKLIIILATIFILGGGFGSAVILKDMSWWFAVTSFLFVIGIIFLVYGIIRAKVLKQLEDLKYNQNAFETTARFVKAKFSSYSSKSSSMNGIPFSFKATIFKKIVYKYVDQNGVEYTSKSAISYTPNQVEYLKDKQVFKIKCDGKVSLITEPMPNGQDTIDIYPPQKNLILKRVLKI